MKTAMKRASFLVTLPNRIHISEEVRKTKKSKSAVIRAALHKAFKTFEPAPTLGRITLEGTSGVASSSYNLSVSLIAKIKAASKGWRYSEAALVNALLDHVFEEKEDESAVSL